MDDKGLNGVIVQATGWDESSPNVKSAAGSFKALRDFADFDTKLKEKKEAGPNAGSKGKPDRVVDEETDVREIRLGSTINLNLPQTSDISVFNAIFKSLKEHLL